MKIDVFIMETVKGHFDLKIDNVKTAVKTVVNNENKPVKGNINVIFCDNEKIVELNKQFFNKDLPIIGFATKAINEDGKQPQEQSPNNLWNIALEKQVSMLESLGLDQKSFLIRQAPELSVEGSSRKAVVRAERFSFSVDNDEFNPRMKKITLSFFLPKGSYATIFIKYLFKC